MKIDVVLDGNRMSITPRLAHYEASLVDVTEFKDSHHHYIPSGKRTLYLEGETETGNVLKGTFELKCVDPAGVHYLKHIRE